MNQIKELETIYFRSDRSVTAILVTNQEGKQRIVYEYNREGLYYKLFFSLQKLLGYFAENDNESFDMELYSDHKVYTYLTKKFTFGKIYPKPKV